ncbi:MAG: transposase [Holosporaceae bacterium]|nr:transposase [Holosporaceae bacterium]
MLDRLYPLSEDAFNEKILPLILEETTPLEGRPPKITHYRCFCAILKVFGESID